MKIVFIATKLIFSKKVFSGLKRKNLYKNDLILKLIHSRTILTDFNLNFNTFKYIVTEAHHASSGLTDGAHNGSKEL